jgi:hypothetical protein
MNALLITTDNFKKKVTIKTFEEAKQLVCSFGYNSPAEVIVLADGTFILIDEEGKLKNLKLNELATQIAHENNSIYPSDYIVGDVLLINDVDEFDLLPFE